MLAILSAELSRYIPILTLTSLHPFNFRPSGLYPSARNRLMYSSGCNRLNTSARSPGVVAVDGPASFSTTAAAMVAMMYECIGREHRILKVVEWRSGKNRRVYNDLPVMPMSIHFQFAGMYLIRIKRTLTSPTTQLLTT
jgi:hypothetical protein